MEFSIFRISLDIHSTSSQVILRVKKGETSRKVHITLREGGQPYHIADGCEAIFSTIKPDGISIHNSCDIKDNTIIYTFNEQTTPAVGMMDCEIILQKDNQTLVSPHFTIVVEEGLFNGDAVISTPEATMLDGLIDRATAAAVSAENVVGDIKSYTNDTFANALRCKKSGTVIQVDDISPVDHEIAVSVDVNGGIVQRYGKNLCREANWAAEPSDTTPVLNLYNVPHGTYTLSAYVTKQPDDTSTNTRIKVAIFYKDGTNYAALGEMDYSSAESDGVKRYKTVTFTTDSTKEIERFAISPLDHTTKNNANRTAEMVQLEIGATATEYEPYKEAVFYTADENGNVAGVISLSPTTTLISSEGATIMAEYTRDSNKVIKELYDYIDYLTSTVARISEVNLPASKWVGSASPYSQVVSIAGTTVNSQVDLTPSVEQLAVFHEKDLAFVTENVDGEVTVYAVGQKPTNDYTIQVTITEVNA